MKLTLFLSILTITQLWATETYSQMTKLTLKLEDVKISEALKTIENQSEFYFLYSPKLINVERKVNIDAEKEPIKDILNDIFDNKVKFIVYDKQIILTPGDLMIPASLLQRMKIEGTVTDVAGKPLIGVTVLVKGTTFGALTNATGKYTIENVPQNATLIFSFIGMETQEIPSNGRIMIDVVLKEVSIGLEEVIVIGYGTQKARNVTGAVSQINTEKLKDAPVSNVGQSLQGKFSGVQIAQTSGEPGSGLSYRIRGQASINAGNSPLFVIDGFPTLSGITNLSPDEIESVSILKDAGATALYGSRAANGVILVTTKSAKSGVRDIQFSAYYGVETVSQRGKPDLMNAQEFAQFKKEWYQDAATYEGYTGGVPTVYQDPSAVIQGTDWFNVLLRPAATQNVNLSISNGVNRLKSSVNFNYNNQEGVILNTWNKRATIRANNSFDLTDKLTIGLNLQGMYRNSQITPGLAGSGNGRQTIASAFLMDPQLKYRNDDGTYPLSFSQPGMFANPNYYLVATQRESPTNDLSALSNAWGEFQIISGLKYKLSANINLGNTQSSVFIPSTAQGAMGSAPPLPATGSYGTRNYMTWLIENTLNYTKTFNEKHNFDAFIGYTTQKASDQSTTITATSFPDDVVDWFNAAATKTGSGSLSEWSLISYVGRLNYNYDGKYLLSMAFRRDGSSRFGSNAKWGNFPSVSLGWIISDENFLKNNHTISYLKLRGSYGKVGNNNIGDYASIASVATSNYVFGGAIANGKALSAIGNNDLTWETTEQYDFGLDFGLLKDRIYLTYDYYWKKTNGLLYAIDIPNQAGFTSIQSNIGEFRFWGHEFGLETKNFVGDFRWNTNLNITFNRNKAVKLGTNNTSIGATGSYDDYNRTVVGQPLGQFYAFIDDGVYMNQAEFDASPHYSSSMVGSSRVKDTNGDGVITFDDRAWCGNPDPKFLFGVTNEFYYKNFDANIVVAGAVGGSIFDGTMSWTENIDGVFNVLKEVQYRWRSEANPGNGVIPSTRAGTTNLMHFGSSRWVKKDDYLAVKNISIGYTLNMKSKRFINSARLYISAQNPLTITNYDGMNPEVGMFGTNGLRDGVDASSYPISIIYSLGFDIKF